MIKSLKEARNAQIHYLKSGDIDEAAAMSELLSVMLAQEILNAFGGIGTTDMCVIVAACKLAHHKADYCQADAQGGWQ